MKHFYSALLAVCALGAFGSTYYVDYASGVDDGEHGGSDAAPWKTLAYALASESVVDGDELVLAKGNHDFSETLTVDKALTIRGTGTPTETVVRNGRRFVVSAAGALVHSISLVNVKINNSASVELSGNSSISNVVISNVGGENSSGFKQTAGVFSHSAITNCPAIGFMWGGLVALSGTAVMEDCVVADNVVSKGHAVKVDGGKVIVRNCTIARNRMQLTGNAALNMASAGKVYNTIIWGNTDGTATVNWTGAANTKNWDTNCTYPLTGVLDTKTIGDDPLFQSDGLHPKKASPCNHKGNPDLATATDIDGLPRGDKPSIGAYEYVNLGELEVGASASPTFVTAPNTITLTPQVQGSYVAPLTYAWDLDGDGVAEVTTETATLSAVGSYTPTLTVRDAGTAEGSYTFGSPLVVHAAGKGTYYLDYAKGSNASNGLTSATAWKDLAYALASPMVIDGDEIVLAKGKHVFSGSVDVGKAVTIRGTGAPTETVLGNGGAQFKISAAGALVHSLCLYDIHISNNDSVSLAGNSIISNVVISKVGGSEGSSSGVGLTAGLLTHAVITNCPSVPFMWGGLVSLRGLATMENCLVADNTMSKAGAVNIRHASAVVRNCTITDNRMKTAGNGAVNMDQSGSLVNNVIWGNEDASGATSVTCDWSGTADTSKWTANCTSVTNGIAGARNIEADPLFSMKKPYHLVRASPCRNAGDDALVALGETDLDGQPRIKGRHVDIGCYELDTYGLMLMVR